VRATNTIAAIAESTGVGAEDIERVFDSLRRIASKSLIQHDEFTLPGVAVLKTSTNDGKPTIVARPIKDLTKFVRDSWRIVDWATRVCPFS
jgi:hypothetical protein